MECKNGDSKKFRLNEGGVVQCGYLGLKGYDHKTVRHSAGEYVNGKASTNGIESFWALLKRGYYGTHIGGALSIYTDMWRNMLIVTTQLACLESQLLLA